MGGEGRKPSGYLSVFEAGHPAPGLSTPSALPPRPTGDRVRPGDRVRHALEVVLIVVGHVVLALTTAVALWWLVLQTGLDLGRVGQLVAVMLGAAASFGALAVVTLSQRERPSIGRLVLPQPSAALGRRAVRLQGVLAVLAVFVAAALMLGGSNGGTGVPPTTISTGGGPLR